MNVWHGDHLRLFHEVAGEVGITEKLTFLGALIGFMHGYEDLYTHQHRRRINVGLVPDAYKAVAGGDFDAMLEEGAFSIEGDGIELDLPKVMPPADDPNFAKQFVFTMLHAAGNEGRCPFSKMVYGRTAIAIAGLKLPTEEELPDYAGVDSTVAIQRILLNRGLRANFPLEADFLWGYVLPDWLEKVVASNFTTYPLPTWTARVLPEWGALIPAPRFALPVLKLRHEGSRTVVMK